MPTIEIRVRNSEIHGDVQVAAVLGVNPRQIVCGDGGLGIDLQRTLESCARGLDVPLCLNNDADHRHRRDRARRSPGHRLELFTGGGELALLDVEPPECAIRRQVAAIELNRPAQQAFGTQQVTAGCVRPRRHVIRSARASVAPPATQRTIAIATTSTRTLAIDVSSARTGAPWWPPAFSYVSVRLQPDRESGLKADTTYLCATANPASRTVRTCGAKRKPRISANPGASRLEKSPEGKQKAPERRRCIPVLKRRRQPTRRRARRARSSTRVRSWPATAP